MSNKLIDLNALSDYKTQSDLKYQDKLTAGTGISIDANNVISATGGGGGGVTLPPAFAFNIQEPDFTSTFTLDNTFSTDVANQQFSNYKLGAHMSIGGTYPGTLYLAHADYMYDNSNAASTSHHIAALFVGNTSKTVDINTTTNTSTEIYTSIKNQIGSSHLAGAVTSGGFSTTVTASAHLIFLTDVMYYMNSGYALYTTPGKLALFSNFYRTCKYVFNANGKYPTGIVAPISGGMNYFYLSGNSGGYSYSSSTSFKVSVSAIVLLK